MVDVWSMSALVCEMTEKVAKDYSLLNAFNKKSVT